MRRARTRYRVQLVSVLPEALRATVLARVSTPVLRVVQRALCGKTLKSGMQETCGWKRASRCVVSGRWRDGDPLEGHHLQGAGAKNQRVNSTAPLQEGWCEGCGPGHASARKGLPVPRLACMWVVGRPGQARPMPGRPALALSAKAGLGLLLVYIVRYLVRYLVRY